VDRTPRAAESAARHPFTVAFLSTCTPRQCGIATFSADVAASLKQAEPGLRAVWAAINDPDSLHTYGPEVRWRVRQGDPDTYRAAAEALNRSNVDLISVQHEFGLYGIWGDPFQDHLLPFLETVRKPVVTTLHTVLPDPSPSVREAVQAIGRYSRAVVAMAGLASEILVETYGLDRAKLRVIPHGVPAIQPGGRTRMKVQLGVQGRTLISTFGLVDPRKGLEYMIGAMEAVVAQHPDVLYLIVGRTHPDLVRKAGEAYRKELYALVRQRGLDKHVAFVDEYLTQRQIIDYLLASDVYVTPYLDPNQITSGTLAYALGAGKAIISTPYLHATEALAGERGLLAPFRSEAGLAQAVLRILDTPAYKHRLESNAYAYGRYMAWPSVGESTLRLYRAVAAGAEPPLAVWPPADAVVKQAAAIAGNVAGPSLGSKPAVKRAPEAGRFTDGDWAEVDVFP
jgi:glycosyltransferase involved in cell wall biosynthesis